MLTNRRDTVIARPPKSLRPRLPALRSAVLGKQVVPLRAMERHQAAARVLAEARMIRKGEKGGR